MNVVVEKLEYQPGGKWDCGVLNFTAQTDLGQFIWAEIVPGPRHGEDSAKVTATLNGVELKFDEVYDLDFEPPNKPGRWADAFVETAKEFVAERLGAWLDACSEELSEAGLT